MSGPVNPKKGFVYDLPSQWEDETPLTKEQIEKFQIGVGTSPSVYDLIVDDLTIEDVQQLSPISLLGKLSYGQKHAAIRTVAKQEFGGMTSEWSEDAPFVLEAVKPNPPANFSIA